jgi:hypothetical protein
MLHLVKLNKWSKSVNKQLLSTPAFWCLFLCSGYSVGATSIKCAEKALNSIYQDVRFGAVTLCAGAVLDAPIQCAEKALSSSYPDVRLGAVELCAGAISDEPIKCAEEALQSSYQDIRFGAVKLCKTNQK